MTDAPAPEDGLEDSLISLAAAMIGALALVMLLEISTLFKARECAQAG